MVSSKGRNGRKHCRRGKQQGAEFWIWEKHSLAGNPEVSSKQDSLDGLDRAIHLAALSKVTLSRKSLKGEEQLNAQDNNRCRC